MKSAYRNLVRNRLYTLINVLGLALGVSCCLVIFLLVRFELSYDSFHTKTDRIYRVTSQFTRGDEIRYFGYTPFPMAEGLRNDFPELPLVTQVYFNFNGFMMDEDNEKFIVNNVVFADHDFLNVFDYELLAGDKENCLANPNTIVLTESMATKIFGSQSPINKVVTLNNSLNLEVTGVVADPPKNNHHPFGILVSYKSFTNQYYELDADINDWDHFDTASTYVVLSPNQSKDQFEELLQGFGTKYLGENFSEFGRYELQPLTDIHFDTRYATSNVASTTDRSTIMGFFVIGLVLLLAACINFINLSTAQSTSRSREVGIRKVMGAFRSQLIYQFLGETLILASLAALISIMFVEVLLPTVNSILGMDLELSLLSDGTTALFLGLLILVVTVLGGIYPALVLSGFTPARVLRSKVQSVGKGGLSLRRFLVITQFLIAQVLVISTIVTYNQVQFFKDKTMGFNPDQVLNFGTGILDSAKQELFKKILLENSGVERVSWFSSSPTNNGHLYGPYRLLDSDDPTKHRTTHRSIDGNYLETFGLELVAGSDIDSEIGKANPGILVNETLLRTAGVTDPSNAVGRRLEGNWLIENSTIVGVVKDFHNQSLHREIIPTIFFYDPQYHWRAAIKLEGSHATGAVQHLESTFEDLLPNGILQYQFEDQRLAQFYEEENKIFDAFQALAIIAILICCLGLFGLVSFVANQKVKEVGIRKVLGANLGHILVLFGNQFMKPLLVAFIIAAPVGFYFMNDWLSNFAFSQQIGVDVFVLTFIASVIIAGVTVSYHSLKSAATNPVDSLRYE